MQLKKLSNQSRLTVQLAARNAICQGRTNLFPNGLDSIFLYVFFKKLFIFLLKIHVTIPFKELKKTFKSIKNDCAIHYVKKQSPFKELKKLSNQSRVIVQFAA